MALGPFNFLDMALGLYNFHDTALTCNNVNMPPLPSGTAKYTTRGPNYAALRLHYLTMGLQYCHRASSPLALWQYWRPLGR